MPKPTPKPPTSVTQSGVSTNSVDATDLSVRQKADAEFEQRHFDRTAELLLNLLRVSDAFDRVFKDVASNEGKGVEASNWIENFGTVRRLLDRALAEHGVVKIDALSRVFDPNLHNAVEAVVEQSMPDDMIVHELKPGYTWGGMVIRKAEVVVNQNKMVDEGAIPSE